MTTITKELTVTEKNETMFAPKAGAIEIDECDCFKPVAKVVRKPRFVALGTALANQPVIVNPVDIDTSEAAMMAADLAALQAGVVEPIATMDAETLDAIEDEKIGELFSTAPYLY